MRYHNRTDKSTACLRLSDGSSWGITAGDAKAVSIVDSLAEAMQLRPSVDISHRLLIRVREGPAELVTPVQREGGVECILGPSLTRDVAAAQMQLLSQVMALYAQDSGGVLLHGALAEKDGKGVLLAGRGEAGKTTASGRLTLPWRSLCDDTALVVRDGEGSYRAHPWPTWSTFMFGGQGGSWDIQRSVPLKGIFLLEQAPEERAEPTGQGEAVCLLSECAEQVTLPVLHSMTPGEARGFRVQRFDNISDLTRAVPVFTLRLSLTGRFWKEIERVL